LKSFHRVNEGRIIFACPDSANEVMNGKPVEELMVLDSADAVPFVFSHPYSGGLSKFANKKVKNCRNVISVADTEAAKTWKRRSARYADAVSYMEHFDHMDFTEVLSECFLYSDYYNEASDGIEAYRRTLMPHTGKCVLHQVNHIAFTVIASKIKKRNGAGLPEKFTDASTLDKPMSTVNGRAWDPAPRNKTVKGLIQRHDPNCEIIDSPNWVSGFRNGAIVLPPRKGEQAQRVGIPFPSIIGCEIAICVLGSIWARGTVEHPIDSVRKINDGGCDERLETWSDFYNDELIELRLRLGMVNRYIPVLLQDGKIRPLET
jgi:hypothetical protein